jgi:hypothetical protein
MRICIAAIMLACASFVSAQEPKQKAKDAIKEIAGTAEFLRAVPKRYGKLHKVDEAKRSATILFDGDKEPTTWALTADAEVKVFGWWGRLKDLGKSKQPRVWAWFKVDRAKKPVAIFMLADEPSEQEIHGDGLEVKSVSKTKIELVLAKGKLHEIAIENCVYWSDTPDFKSIKPKDRLFMHQGPREDGKTVTTLYDRAALEKKRALQKATLRELWVKEGLPGAIGFLHVYSGEVDVLVDHEGMRWGRSLAPGDKVEIADASPIKGVVKSVQAQREKTQVRLVVKTFDLADLQMGQRVHMKMNAPTAEVENALIPPGIHLPKTKEERIDWFMANTYCTCGVGGDGCTGHFYTLASCNPNACGAPNMTRNYIGKKIDEGWTNCEIFDALYKQRGPMMLRPHLLP